MLESMAVKKGYGVALGNHLSSNWVKGCLAINHIGTYQVIISEMVTWIKWKKKCSQVELMVTWLKWRRLKFLFHFIQVIISCIIYLRYHFDILEPYNIAQIAEPNYVLARHESSIAQCLERPTGILEGHGFNSHWGTQKMYFEDASSFISLPGNNGRLNSAVTFLTKHSCVHS